MRTLDQHQQEADAALAAEESAKWKAYGACLVQIAVSGMDRIQVSDGLLSKGIDGRKQALQVLGLHAKSMANAHGDLLWPSMTALNRSMTQVTEDLAICIAICLGRKLSAPSRLLSLEKKREAASNEHRSWNLLSAEEGGIRALKLQAVNKEANAVSEVLSDLETDIEARQAAGTLAAQLSMEFPYMEANPDG